MRTLTPTSVFVTTAPVPTEARRWMRPAAFFAPVGCPAHSGHLIPTEAKFMQSGQIGRPHVEQLTAVSRLGWR